ncbi:hypothetical protein V8F20_009912 [Naviculisporaceae sp. PSN 640]
MAGPRTEILVHVAAPSRATDDEQYRTLARGYLDFRPTRRTPFFEAPTEDDDLTQEFRGPEVQLSQQQSTQQSKTGESFSIESPLLSFRSAQNNLNSPRLRQPRPVQEEEEGLQSSWQAPPSEIQDTYPDSNLPLPELCSPTRLLEHYISTGYSSQLDMSPLASRSAGRQQNPYPFSQETTRPFSSPEQPRTQPNDGHNDVSNQSIPTSLLGPVNGPAETSELPPPSSRKRPVSPVQEASKDNAVEIIPDARGGSVIPQSPPVRSKRPLLAQPTARSSGSAGDISHITSSYPSENGKQSEKPALSRAESEPPRAKRARISNKDPEPGKTLPRSKSDMGPGQKDQRTQGKPSSTGFRGLEINSPEPKVSERDIQPEDLIAEPIGSLAKNLDLKKRFNPESQTREIRPFERGHWLIDCTTWDEDLKWSSWSFLYDYLSKGLAGWGVRCERDEEFSRIRLWCFGYMVGHLHLLLYLVSKRQVILTGSCWIGAEGSPVIVMAAKSQNNGT